MSPEQQQINNTQLTSASARVENNNNSGDDFGPKSDVVVALLDHGISQKVAQRLASRYSQERVLQKISYVDYLVAEAPDKVQKPNGWLRRAIEEDYGAPDGYISPEDRERQAAAEEERLEAEEKTTAAAEKRSKAQQREILAEQEARVDALRREQGTTADDLALWERAKTELKYIATPDINSLIPDLEMLNVCDGKVLLGAWSEATWRRLQHPGTAKVFERVLSQVADGSVELQVLEIKHGAVQT